MQITLIGVLLLICAALSILLYQNMYLHKNSASGKEKSADALKLSFRDAINHYIHNLKSPISSVFLAIDNIKLMIEKEYDRNEIFDVLDEAKISAGEINDRIQEISLLTRRSAANNHLLDVEQLISSVLEDNEFNKTIRQIKADHPVEIIIDEQALFLVLRKLLEISMNYKAPQENLFIESGTFENPKNHYPAKHGIKIFTKKYDSEKILYQHDMQEISLDDQTNLIFIKYFLSNNNAVLNGGITMNKRIYWEILFNGTGNFAQGKDSTNR